MEDDCSGGRSRQTLAQHRNSNGNGKRKIGLCDRPESGFKGRDGEKADEEDCGVEVWISLSNSFNQVQSVLDQNNVLIRQVNENQQSKIPDNLAKNVALIREINTNISKDNAAGLLEISSACRLVRNGGICMHDEAAPHYIDMIDQTTQGHQFIKEEFGIIPRIGWQIDPFGHSAVQAYLLGAEVGFDSVFFGRIDYQDRDKRKGDKSLEVIWRGSKSLGSTAQIFAGAFPANYEPPSGFYFEVNSDSPVVQDNIDLFDYNVQERVNDFVAAAIAQANITRTNHIMWTMGTYFQYQYAHTWFRNMDKLIHYVNMDGRVNALYSTPSIYLDAKHAADESCPLKIEDYFPYADRINAYWTGYFSSRPALKRYVRDLNGYYLAARQLDSKPSLYLFSCKKF